MHCKLLACLLLVIQIACQYWNPSRSTPSDSACEIWYCWLLMEEIRLTTCYIFSVNTCIFYITHERIWHHISMSNKCMFFSATVVHRQAMKRHDFCVLFVEGGAKEGGDQPQGGGGRWTFGKGHCCAKSAKMQKFLEVEVKRINDWWINKRIIKRLLSVNELVVLHNEPTTFGNVGAQPPRPKLFRGNKAFSWGSPLILPLIRPYLLRGYPSIPMK